MKVIIVRTQEDSIKTALQQLGLEAQKKVSTIDEVIEDLRGVEIRHNVNNEKHAVDYEELQSTLDALGIEGFEPPKSTDDIAKEIADILCEAIESRAQEISAQREKENEDLVNEYMRRYHYFKI